MLLGLAVRGAARRTCARLHAHVRCMHVSAAAMHPPGAAAGAGEPDDGPVGVAERDGLYDVPPFSNELPELEIADPTELLLDRPRRQWYHRMLYVYTDKQMNELWSYHGYYTCRNAALRQKFYAEARVPQDFKSMQMLITMHLWMVHCHLGLEGEDGKQYETFLYDRCWEDVTRRLKHAGANTMSLNRLLKGVQAYSIEFSMVLDECARIMDEGERIEEFARAIQQYVLDQQHDAQDEAEGEKLAAPDGDDVPATAAAAAADTPPSTVAFQMAQYLFDELVSVMSLPYGAVKTGRFEWATLPRFGGEGSRRRTPLAIHHDLLIRKGPWLPEVDLSGKLYYWNHETRKSVWTLPKTAGGNGDIDNS